MRSFATSFNDSKESVVVCAPPAGRNHIHIRHWRASDAAAFATTLVVFEFATTMFLTRTGGAGLGMFTFEHVRFLDMVDYELPRAGASRGFSAPCNALCARSRYDHPPFCPCPADNRVPSSQGSPYLLDRTEEPAPAITSGFHGVDCGGYVSFGHGSLVPGSHR